MSFVSGIPFSGSPQGVVTGSPFNYPGQSTGPSVQRPPGSPMVLPLPGITLPRGPSMGTTSAGLPFQPPTTPVQPAQPFQPTTPVQVFQPLQPTTPVQPVQPFQPSTPGQPFQPSTVKSPGLSMGFGPIISPQPRSPVTTAPIPAETVPAPSPTVKKTRKGKDPVPSQLYGIIYNHIISSRQDIPPEVVGIIRSLALTRRSEQGNFKIGNNEGSLFYQDLPAKGRLKAGGGKTHELTTTYTVQDMVNPAVLDRVTNDVITFIRKYAVIAEKPSEVTSIDISWSIFSKTMQATDLLRQFFTSRLNNLDVYIIDRLVTQMKLMMAIGSVSESAVIMKRNPDSSVEIQQIDGVTIIQNQITGELNIVLNNTPAEPVIGQPLVAQANAIREAKLGLLQSNSYYVVSNPPERSIAVFSKMSERYGTRQLT